jgi:hypothetical protein
MIAANGRALSMKIAGSLYSIASATVAVFLSILLTGVVYLTLHLPIIPAGRAWIDDNCAQKIAVSNLRASARNAICTLATLRDR